MPPEAQAFLGLAGQVQSLVQLPVLLDIEINHIFDPITTNIVSTPIDKAL